MIAYSLNRQNIYLPATDGSTIKLSITPDSGRIVYRNKVGTVIGIKHPGIELGKDLNGKKWYIHHHYKNATLTIEQEDLFSQGQEVIYDNRAVSYDKFEIIERSLLAWSSGKEYSWLLQNCQHFVNEVALDKHTSESINEISDFALFASVVTGLAGLITGNKALIATGAGLALAGGTAKVLSNKNSLVSKSVNRSTRARKFQRYKVA